MAFFYNNNNNIYNKYNLYIMSSINLDKLSDKINDLYNDRLTLKSIYNIIKKNNEKYVKTKTHILVDLNSLSENTINEIQNYLMFVNDINKEFKDYNNIKKELIKDINKEDKLE